MQRCWYHSFLRLQTRQAIITYVLRCDLRRIHWYSTPNIVTDNILSVTFSLCSGSGQHSAAVPSSPAAQIGPTATGTTTQKEQKIRTIRQKGSGW